MTTETTTTAAATNEDGKKLSKKEITAQRIAANVAAIEATLSLEPGSTTPAGGKEALAIVAEANGSSLQEIQKAAQIEDEFALCTTIAMQNMFKQAAQADAEMKTLTHSFPMTGRNHFDVSVHRTGETDLRMVRHSTNTNAGAMKEAVSDFAAAMAIFAAKESSADAVKTTT